VRRDVELLGEGALTPVEAHAGAGVEGDRAGGGVDGRVAVQQAGGVQGQQPHLVGAAAARLLGQPESEDGGRERRDPEGVPACGK
jgi:hypothetical protein